MAQLRVPCSFFDISRHLRDKYFHIIGGTTSPKDPPNGALKNQLFELLKQECQCFFISIDIYQKNILTWFGSIPRGPLIEPHKNHFFEWLKLGCQCFLTLVDIQETNILK